MNGKVFINRATSLRRRKIVVSLFITMIVMNGILASPEIVLIGKYGKIIIAFIGIFLFTQISLLSKFISSNKLLLIFWALCNFFYFFSLKKDSFSLEIFLSNFLLVFYLYFIYLTVQPVKGTNYKRIILKLLEISAVVLNMNFIFWTLVSFLFGWKIWVEIEGRIGLGLYYQNYIQMSIFGVTSAIIHFYLFKLKNNSRKHLFWFFVYVILVVLTSSRNAQLILFLTVLIYFLNPLMKFILKIKFVIFTSILVIVLSIIQNPNYLMENSVVQFTTGRSSIWFYVYEHYKNYSILSGNGLFGLNQEILFNNIDQNYYFQRIDTLYFHSSYIEIFAGAGLIGLIIFMIFLFKSIDFKMNVFRAFLSAFLIGCLFEGHLIQPIILSSTLFWFLFYVNQQLFNEKK